MGTGGLGLAGYASGRTWTRQSQYRAKCHATALFYCASSRRYIRGQQLGGSVAHRRGNTYTAAQWGGSVASVFFEECTQSLNWYSVVPAGHKEVTQGQTPLQQLGASFDKLSQKVAVLLDGSRHAARGSSGGTVKSLLSGKQQRWHGLQG
jgi:hypothetical protein